MACNVETRLQNAIESDSNSGKTLDVVLRFDVPKLNDVSAEMPLVQRRLAQAQLASERIQAVLDRTGRVSGEGPAQVSLFPAVGSAYVQAPLGFLKALLDQEEVLGATLNAPSGPK